MIFTHFSNCYCIIRAADVKMWTCSDIYPSQLSPSTSTQGFIKDLTKCELLSDGGDWKQFLVSVIFLFLPLSISVSIHGLPPFCFEDQISYGFQCFFLPPLFFSPSFSNCIDWVHLCQLSRPLPCISYVIFSLSHPPVPSLSHLTAVRSQIFNEDLFVST